jgi:myo-inositol-1(or 4)-monophosphatase
VETDVVEVAVQAAVQAGRLLQQMLSAPWEAKGVTTKRGPADLVTRADRMAEDVIVGVLQERCPGHGILAEEGTVRAGGPYRWIVDPLDGTTNFAHGVPLFAVSVALARDDELVAGVVYHPPLDELFVAERGGGAYLRRGDGPQRLRVSEVASVADAVVATGLPYQIRETGVNIAQIQRLMRTAIEVRILGAAALHLAYVAAGRVEAFWEPGLNPWDVAAGALLVEEAGGRVTDMRGRPFGLDCRDVLATNGRVHEEMVALLAPDSG